jgi:hypothetical protein
LSHPPPPSSLSRTGKIRRGRTTRSGPANGGLNRLNPYSLDANGWCEPTDSRALAYEREGPPADPRASVVSGGDREHIARQLGELRKIKGPPVAVEPLYHAWAEHPRREAVSALFPELRGSHRRQALRREVGRVRVRSARGEVIDLETKVRGCPAIAEAEAERILEVLVDLRHAWKTRDADAGYDEINWRHACQEVGQILDVAEESRLDAFATEDAVLASLFSDAAKLKGNFLTHHIDGAVGAALVLPRFLDMDHEEGRTRLVTICQAILEHQVGPPRFMAQMVRMGIEEQHRVLVASGRVDEAGSLEGLEGLQQKIADPLNPQHVTLHPHGYGVLDVDEREAALLARVGLPAWYVPHPATPWFVASSAVIDADSLVNYVTPDGVGKIVAICGPGTPFHDATVFHSIFSCGASFVDAVSVMSDTAMSAMRDGVQRTRSTIEEVRAQVLSEIEEGWLYFSPNEFRVIVEEEDVDVAMITSTRRDGEILVDVPWSDGANLPYWNVPLDYAEKNAAYEFAKLLRRRVADLLREP